MAQSTVSSNQLLEIVASLTEAMELSYGSYTSLRNQLGVDEHQKSIQQEIISKKEGIDAEKKVAEAGQGNVANLLSLINNIMAFSAELETKKSEIFQELPDFTHLHNEILHENDVLLDSEHTLRVMIDQFSTDKENFRLYKDYLNDRVNLNASMQQLLPPQDMSTPWRKLQKDLACAEDIQMRHEILKRGLMDNLTEFEGLDSLIQDINAVLDISEELIDKLCPAPLNPQSTEVLKNLEDLKKRRDEVDTPPVKGSTLEKNIAGLNKLKGLTDILREHEQLKADALEHLPQEVSVELDADTLGRPRKQKRPAPQHSYGYINFPAIHKDINAKLKVAEELGKTVLGENNDPIENARHDKIRARSAGLRKKDITPDPVGLLGDKVEMFAEHMDFIRDELGKESAAISAISEALAEQVNKELDALVKLAVLASESEDPDTQDKVKELLDRAMEWQKEKDPKDTSEEALAEKKKLNDELRAALEKMLRKPRQDPRQHLKDLNDILKELEDITNVANITGDESDKEKAKDLNERSKESRKDQATDPEKARASKIQLIKDHIEGIKPRVLTPESIQGLTAERLDDQLKELEAVTEGAREEQKALALFANQIKAQIQKTPESMYDELKNKSALINNLIDNINAHALTDEEIQQQAIAVLGKQLRALESTTDSIGKNGTPDTKEITTELNSCCKEARLNPNGTREGQMKQLQHLINAQLDFTEPKLDKDNELKTRELDAIDNLLEALENATNEIDAGKDLALETNISDLIWESEAVRKNPQGSPMDVLKAKRDIIDKHLALLNANQNEEDMAHLNAALGIALAGLEAITKEIGESGDETTKQRADDLNGRSEAARTNPQGTPEIQLKIKQGLINEHLELQDSKAATAGALNSQVQRSLNNALKELEKLTEAINHNRGFEVSPKKHDLNKKSEEARENQDLSPAELAQLKQDILNQHIDGLKPNAIEVDPLIQQALAHLEKVLEGLEGINDKTQSGLNPTDLAKSKDLNERSKKARDEPLINAEKQLQRYQDLVNEHLDNLSPKVEANDEEVKAGLKNILNTGLLGLEDVTSQFGSKSDREGDAARADAINERSKAAREDITTDPLSLHKEKQGCVNAHLACLKENTSDDDDAPEMTKKLTALDEQIKSLEALAEKLGKSDDPKAQKRAKDILDKLRDARLNPQGTLDQQLSDKANAIDDALEYLAGEETTPEIAKDISQDLSKQLEDLTKLLEELGSDDPRVADLLARAKDALQNSSGDPKEDIAKKAALIKEALKLVDSSPEDAQELQERAIRILNEILKGLEALAEKAAGDDIDECGIVLEGSRDARERAVGWPDEQIKQKQDAVNELLKFLSANHPNAEEKPAKKSKWRILKWQHDPYTPASLIVTEQQQDPAIQSADLANADKLPWSEAIQQELQKELNKDLKKLEGLTRPGANDAEDSPKAQLERESKETRKKEEPNDYIALTNKKAVLNKHIDMIRGIIEEDNKPLKMAMASLDSQLADLEAINDAASQGASPESREKVKDLNKRSKKARTDQTTPQKELFARKQSLLKEHLETLEPIAKGGTEVQRKIQEELDAKLKALEQINAAAAQGRNAADQKRNEDLIARSKDARENPKGSPSDQIAAKEKLLDELTRMLEENAKELSESQEKLTNDLNNILLAAEDLTESVVRVSNDEEKENAHKLAVASKNARESKDPETSLKEKNESKFALLKNQLDYDKDQSDGNIDALKIALEAEESLNNTTKILKQGVWHLRSKLGAPKSPTKKVKEDPEEEPEIKHTGRSVNHKLTVGALIKEAHEHLEDGRRLASLIDSIPDYEKGHKALEVYMAEIGSEQKEFDVLSRQFTEGVPIHNPFRNEVPPGALAFNILADEIIAFCPIKNEQTKNIKPLIEATLKHAADLEVANEGLRKDNKMFQNRVKELEEEVENLKADRDNLNSGAVEFEATLEAKEAEIDELNDQIAEYEMIVEELSKYKPMYEDLLAENEKLRERIRELELLLSDTEKILKATEDEKNFLAQKAAENEAFKQKALDLEKELANMVLRLASAEELMGDKDNAAQELIDKLNEEMFGHIERNANLEGKIRDYEDAVIEAQRQKDHNLMRKTLDYLWHKRETWLMEAWLMWKNYQPPQPVETMVEEEVFELEVDPEDELDRNVDVRLLEAGRAILSIWQTYVLENNEVLQTWKRNCLKNEKPMSYLNIFRFFEEMMDKKFKVDSEDLLARRKPRTMPEFLLEHLNRMFGLKKIAYRHLAQIMPALNQLVMEGQTYGTLLARLLQIFHPSPVMFPLAMFLTRARIQFNKLVERSNKDRGIQEDKRGVKQNRPTKASGKSHGLAAYDVAACGGEALCFRVLTLIYTLFEKDSRSGQLMLKLCKPLKVSEPEYVIFKLCHKISKKAVDVDSVYDALDTDLDGFITREEFCAQLPKHMDLPVSQQCMQKAFDYIDYDRSGTIEREEFMAAVNLNNYQNNMKSDDYLVSKSQFLNALTETYIARQRNRAARLVNLFTQKHPSGQCTLAEAADIVYYLDPDISMDRMAVMEHEWAHHGDTDSVSQDDFIRSVLLHNVKGMGYGVFLIPELDQATGDRSLITNEVLLITGGPGARVNVEFEKKKGGKQLRHQNTMSSAQSREEIVTPMQRQRTRHNTTINK